MPSVLAYPTTSIDALIEVADRRLAAGGLHDVVISAARNVAPSLELSYFEHERRAQAHARVYDAFLAEGVAEHDFAGSSGYGYHDSARERYESLLARIFRAERVLARLSIVSGTHAIVVALAAVASPGTRLISATGKPYDTLRNAIADAPGSLAAQGVVYEEIPLDPEGALDLDALVAALEADAAPAPVIFVQRSRGYAPRPSLSVDDIERLAARVRAVRSEAVIAVDNCYCELVEDREPLEAGADLVMGSLIKNLGGGIAPAGGYVAGRAALVELVATRLYAPGLGDALGPTLGLGRLFMQGLFMAPSVIWEAVRGLNFATALFDELGLQVDPVPLAPRRDIVQAIRLDDRRRLEIFATALQRSLPVNARFRPEPGTVPGYSDAVIMSSGSFVGGATIELSCDAPLRPPYEMYLQGGIAAEHTVLGSLAAAHALLAA